MLSQWQQSQLAVLKNLIISRWVPAETDSNCLPVHVHDQRSRNVMPYFNIYVHYVWIIWTSIKTTVTYEVECGFMHYFIVSFYLKSLQNFE